MLLNSLTEVPTFTTGEQLFAWIAIAFNDLASSNNQVQFQVDTATGLPVNRTIPQYTATPVQDAFGQNYIQVISYIPLAATYKTATVQFWKSTTETVSFATLPTSFKKATLG